MFPSLEGFTMKPFQAFGCRALLLVLILHGGIECRPIQETAPYYIRSSLTGSRRPTAGEYFIQDGEPVNVHDIGSKDKYQELHRLVENTRITRDDEHLEVKEVEFPRSSSQEIYTDDDDGISGSGQDGDSDSLNFRDSSHGIFGSRDNPHLKKAGNRPTHHKMKPSDSGTVDFGGAGILWSLVVIAFVLAVVSIVFVRRTCCMGTTPDVDRLESVKVAKSGQLLASDQSALKEARIRVGKQKSRENRKVLRKLSMDQGVRTEKEELAIACSVIAPTIDTRKRNSEALHTRACIRGATSHSRRNSSFEEDIQKARCEFVNAPARFAKLVSLAGDGKEAAEQDSNSQAVESDPQ